MTLLGKLWLILDTKQLNILRSGTISRAPREAAEWASEAQNEASSWGPSRRVPGVPGGLPPAANAGHVSVKLPSQTAASAPFQEGGPDGGFKQLPPVLIQFCKHNMTLFNKPAKKSNVQIYNYLTAYFSLKNIKTCNAQY